MNLIDYSEVHHLPQVFNPIYPQYATMKSRRRTFKRTEDISAIISSFIANAGFFYFGDNDKIKCFYCGGILDYSQIKNSNIWKEHSNLNTNCKFLTEYEKGNFEFTHYAEPSVINRNNTEIPVSTNNNMNELIEENRQLKENQECKICLDNKIDIVLLPCRHLVCCTKCVSKLSLCIICRETIHNKIKVFT
jgi:baculoviral IAP repeat-containing protein 7/8